MEAVEVLEGLVLIVASVGSTALVGRVAGRKYQGWLSRRSSSVADMAAARQDGVDPGSSQLDLVDFLAMAGSRGKGGNDGRGNGNGGSEPRAGSPEASARIPLEHIADANVERRGETAWLVLVIGEPNRPRYRLGRPFPTAEAAAHARDEILRRRESRLDTLERHEFETLAQGAELQFQWAHQLGLDEQWLYSTRLRTLEDGGRPGTYLPASRWRLAAIRQPGHAVCGNQGLLTLGLQQGDETLMLCLVTPDTTSARTICEALRAHGGRQVSRMGAHGNANGSAALPGSAEVAGRAGTSTCSS